MMDDDSASTPGQKLALAFDLSFSSLCNDIINSVNQQDLNKLLSSIRNVDPNKVRMKYNSFLKDTIQNQIRSMFQEETFVGKLDLLCDLNSKTPSNTLVWRPAEEKFDKENLYRNHRIKNLKENIEKMKDKLQCEKVKGQLLKNKLDIFLKQSNDETIKITNIKKELETASEILTSATTQYDDEIQEFRRNNVKPIE